MAGYAFASMGPRTYARATLPPVLASVSIAKAMSSLDGITWTDRTIAGALSVCYAPSLGKFCAVNGNGNTYTSPDGITWTNTSAQTTCLFNFVCWSPDKSLFVATGTPSGLSGVVVMTSPDGTTWTGRTGSHGITWKSVVWSPGQSLFVAVGADNGDGDTKVVMTSPDGTTWTQRTITPHGDLRCVCWSPGLSLFVAVGRNFGTLSGVITSPDGITWTARTDPISSGTYNSSVCWSADQSLLVKVDLGGGVTTSSDGITWSSQTSAEANNWQCVIWSHTLLLFVAVASTGTHRVQTSPNGTTWTARTASSANSWNSVAATG